MQMIFIGEFHQTTHAEPNMAASACPYTSVCVVMYAIAYISIIEQGIYKERNTKFNNNRSSMNNIYIRCLFLCLFILYLIADIL